MPNGKEITEEDRKKYTLSIFIMLFPSLILAVVGTIPLVLIRQIYQIPLINVFSAIIVTVIIQGILIFFQGIMIKNFADDYYGL